MAPPAPPPSSTSFLLSGAITIGSQAPIDLPDGSGWTADIDDTTGAITNGEVTIPTFTITPVPGIDVGVTISDVAPATGQLDTGTGAIDLSSHFQLVLSIPALTATCTVTPINVDTTTSGGGSPLSGDPATATLVGSEFTVPAIVGTGADGDCPDSTAAVLNGPLGLNLPTSSTNITLTIVETATPVTTQTTTTPTTAKATTTTAKAAAANATTANPSFTG